MQSVQLLEKSKGTFEGLSRTEVRTIIAELTPQLALMIGDAKLEARFVESIITLCLDDKLKKCDAISVISAAYTSASLNLSINPTMGEGYVVPYNVNIAPKDAPQKIWKSFAQFQIGYNGYKKMAFNAGVQAIFGKAVYKNDDFSFSFGINPSLSHKPNFASDELEYVYFTWVINGIKEFDCVNKAWVENRRLRNKSQQASYSNPNALPKDAWATDYPTMAIGKLIKYCRRFIPLSPEFVAMAESDERVLIGKLDKDGKLEITPHEEVDDPTPPKVDEKEPVKQALTASIVEQIICYGISQKDQDPAAIVEHYAKTIEMTDAQKAGFIGNFKKRLFDEKIEWELVQAMEDRVETIETLSTQFYFTSEQRKQYSAYKGVKNG
jgi:recombination protein RecT